MNASDNVRITRRHWDRIFAVAVAVAIPAILVRWVLVGNALQSVGTAAALGLYFLVLWAVMRFSTPVGGYEMPRLMKTLPARLVVLTLVWLVLAAAILFGHGAPREPVTPLQRVLLGVWFVSLLFLPRLAGLGTKEIDEASEKG